jgi:hypothetical protein
MHGKDFRSISAYRNLDIDDLVLIKLLGEGATTTEMSKVLRVSPAAVCHRMRKYNSIWPDFSTRNLESKKEKRVFCDAFPDIYRRACLALEVLSEGVIKSGTAFGGYAPKSCGDL